MRRNYENLKEEMFRVPPADDDDGAIRALASFRRELRERNSQWLDADGVFGIFDECRHPARWAWVLHGTGTDPQAVAYWESYRDPTGLPGQFPQWLARFDPVSPDDFAWAVPLYCRLHLFADGLGDLQSPLPPRPTVDRFLRASRGWILDSESLRRLIRLADFDSSASAELASVFERRNVPPSKQPERQAVRIAGMRILSEVGVDGTPLLEILEERCLFGHTIMAGPPYEIGSRLFAALQ